MRKCTVLMLIACLFVSCLIVHAVVPVSAQTGYKPSVPQFSVKIIDKSYDEPPSTTTNPLTGETTALQGYRVNQRSIEITIKNQPFTPYTDLNGYKIDLYYQIEFKGHFANDKEWQTFFNSSLTYDATYSNVQSNSGYTVVLSSPYSTTMYPDGSQLDFRVEAVIGYYIDYTVEDILTFRQGQTLVRYEQSGYSSIQTITITSESSSSPPSQMAVFPSVTSDDGDGQSQPPDQTHTPNGMVSSPFVLFGASVLFTGVVIAVVLLFLRRHLKTQTYTNDSSQSSKFAEC